MRATFIHCPKCKKIVAQVCEGEHVCGEEEEAPVQRLGGVKKPRGKKK